MSREKQFNRHGFEISPNSNSASGYTGVGVYPNDYFRAFVHAPERFRYLMTGEKNNVLVLARSRNPVKMAYYRQQFLMEVERWGWDYMIRELQEVGTYNWQPNRRFKAKDYQ